MHDITAAALLLRWSLYVLLLALAGLSWFAGLLRRSHADAALAAFGPWQRAGTLLALGLSTAGLLQQAASMAGVAWQELDAETLRWLITDSALGRAWLLRMLALLVLLSLPWRERAWPLQTLAGLLALCTLPWSGHAGAGLGWPGQLQLLADMLHLIAAAGWAAALLGFSGLLFGARRQPDGGVGALRAALAAFARPGSAIVLVLLLTGVIRSADLVGWPPVADWLHWPYVRWLGLKLLLLGGMLLLAARHRWRLVPELDPTVQQAATPAFAGVRARRLRRSVYLETLLLLLLLAVVAVLGMTPPPGHAR